MLSFRVAANRNTFRMLATELPVPAGTPPQEASAIRLTFLQGVVEVFDSWGRQLTGEVYLCLLRVCTTAPGGATVASNMVERRCVQQESIRGKRATFVLRQAQMAEAARLEARLASGLDTMITEDEFEKGRPVEVVEN